MFIKLTVDGEPRHFSVDFFRRNPILFVAAGKNGGTIIHTPPSSLPQEGGRISVAEPLEEVLQLLTVKLSQT